jgi:hypothetical protein
MTITEATRILRPPLKFGDPLQVNARKFLEKIEEAKESARNCKRDHAEKVRYDKFPEDEIKNITLCACLDGYDHEIAYETARALVNEWKRR